MKAFLKLFQLAVLCTLVKSGYSQGNDAQVHGNFEFNYQWNKEDTTIDSYEVPEKTLSQGYGNVIMTKGNFTAGARFEFYEPPMLGIDGRYRGSGIPYKFITYANEGLEVTAGNYYEQFGSGMMFRSYQAPLLGLDNVMNGFRIKYNPYKGVYLKGVSGRQRLFWEDIPTLLRGGDAEFSINEMVPKMSDWKTQVVLGGSMMNKYQESNNVHHPENTDVYGGRFSITRSISRTDKSPGTLVLSGEYVHKKWDPSTDNRYVYRDGKAILGSLGYSQKGFGISLTGKLIDNMAFRADRDERANWAFINYLPALTRQHAYMTAASFYPYATQPFGELAFQGEIVYKVPKKSLLGGKYGMGILINASAANGLDTTRLAVEEDIDHPMGYTVDDFSLGGENYFRDLNVEVSKKFSKKVKGIFSFIHLQYNFDVNHAFQTRDNGMVHANIYVADVSYKIAKKHTIRIEGQYMDVNEGDEFYHDEGDWAFGLIEYTFSPHWSLSFWNLYQFENEDTGDPLHYLTTQLVYIRNNHRVTLRYGRQREGLICAGGVCRPTPAANGFIVTVTSNF